MLALPSKSLEIRRRSQQLHKIDWADEDRAVEGIIRLREATGANQVMDRAHGAGEEIRAANQFAREYELGLWGACEAFRAPVAEAAPEPTPAPFIQQPPPTVQPLAPVVKQPAPAPSGKCDLSYPTQCLPSFPDQGRGEIGDRRFPVVPPDLPGFDGDSDGVGCESG